MAEPFHLDVAQLNAYLTQAHPREDIPSPRQILQTAYNAFVAAGVLKLYDRPITPNGPLEVRDDGITLRYDKKTLFWTFDRIPPLEGLIAGLAYHLAAVVNEPPTPGPWPKTLDV
jgi:hypothetical protein